jgi:hypothetical protein
MTDSVGEDTTTSNGVLSWLSETFMRPANGWTMSFIAVAMCARHDATVWPFIFPLFLVAAFIFWRVGWRIGL